VNRRSLLVLMVALALLSSGCIPIANPQFDARYHAKRTPTHAVFAQWRYTPYVNPPFTDSATQLTIVEIARPSRVVTLGLEDASAVSDVMVVGGRPRVLVAEAGRIAEVDLLSRRVSVVASGPTSLRTSALGAAYAPDGALVSWYETVPGLGFTVHRRLGPLEQSASVSFFELFQSLVPLGEWRPRWQWSAREMMLLAADDYAAYLVDADALPWGQDLPRTTVWRADFASGKVAEFAVGGAHYWPLPLAPAGYSHAGRALRRYGVPVEPMRGEVAFLSLSGGVRAVSTLPTYPAEVVVQPGGERYLAIRYPGTILAGSFGHTSTVTLLERAPAQGSAFIGLRPLGMLGDTLAYSAPAETAVPPYPPGRSAAIELRFLDTRTHRDSLVATTPVAFGAQRFDFLGSYAR
jgi:hypothetical protein